MEHEWYGNICKIKIKKLVALVLVSRATFIVICYKTLLFTNWITKEQIFNSKTQNGITPKKSIQKIDRQ